MLFVDFELTGGQDVFKEAFRVGSVEGGDNPLSAYETYPVPEQKLLDDPGTWEKAYEDVVANGQAID
jgi:iron(III) transport system substrate-binding protein